MKISINSYDSFNSPIARNHKIVHSRTA